MTCFYLRDLILHDLIILLIAPAREEAADLYLVSLHDLMLWLADLKVVPGVRQSLSKRPNDHTGRDELEC